MRDRALRIISRYLTPWWQNVRAIATYVQACAMMKKHVPCCADQNYMTVSAKSGRILVQSRADEILRVYGDSTVNRSVNTYSDDSLGRPDEPRLHFCFPARDCLLSFPGLLFSFPFGTLTSYKSGRVLRRGCLSYILGCAWCSDEASPRVRSETGGSSTMLSKLSLPPSGSYPSRLEYLCWRFLVLSFGKGSRRELSDDEFRGCFRCVSLWFMFLPVGRASLPIRKGAWRLRTSGVGSKSRMELRFPWATEYNIRKAFLWWSFHEAPYLCRIDWPPQRHTASTLLHQLSVVLSSCPIPFRAQGEQSYELWNSQA